MPKVVTPTGQQFTELSKLEFGETLAQQLVPVADGLRDIETQFGMRNYIVRLVWTRWSEGERGFGVEEVLRAEALLPTPLVEAVEQLDEMLRPVGVEEQGQVKVSEVSGRYTEYYLRGLQADGSEVPGDQQFYYEIEYPSENGRFPGIKRRFSLAKAPAYKPDQFAWEFVLQKAIQNREPDGTPATMGVDDG